MGVQTIVIRIPDDGNGTCKAIDRILANFKKSLQEHEFPFEICFAAGKSFAVKKPSRCHVKGRKGRVNV